MTPLGLVIALPILVGAGFLCLLAGSMTSPEKTSSKSAPGPRSGTSEGSRAAGDSGPPSWRDRVIQNRSTGIASIDPAKARQEAGNPFG